MAPAADQTTTDEANTGPSPVLRLPLGRSVYGRLLAAARREGVDVVTLADHLVRQGLGCTTWLPRHTQRPDLGLELATVCLHCGRERPSPALSRCGVCHGPWTVGVA
jgi:hypothetical protein